MWQQEDRGVRVWKPIKSALLGRYTFNKNKYSFSLGRELNDEVEGNPGANLLKPGAVVLLLVSVGMVQPDLGPIPSKRARHMKIHLFADS